jgi:hypothetical protein
VSEETKRLIPYEEKTPAAKKELAQWAERQYLKCARYREPWERMWETNLLYLADKSWEAAGDDFNTWNRQAGGLGIGSKPKMTANNILPLYRQAHATIVDNLATTEAVAASASKQGKASADVGTDLIGWRDYVDDSARQRADIVAWLLVSGVGFEWPFWDDDAVIQGVSGEQVKGLGDLKSMVLNPWNVHLPPYSDCMTDPDYIIISDCHSIDEINDVYDAEVKGETVASAMGRADNLRNIIVSGRSSPEARKDAAILKRMLVAPIRDYPRGRFIVWANEELLYDGELPEKILGLIRYDWLKVPLSLYGLSFIWPLVPVQRQINITLSQQVDLVNRDLRQDFYLKGTQRPMEEWVNLDGEETCPWRAYADPTTGSKIIYLDSTIQEYTPVRYTANYTEADAFIASLWNQQMRLAGLHEPSTGDAVASGTTATTVLTLKQADYTGIAAIRKGVDRQIAKANRQKLLVLQEHVSVPRIARYTNNDEAKSLMFIGSDLRGISDVRARSVPITDQATELQLRDQAGLEGLFGPYLDPLDMQSKYRRLLSKGIPNMREEIDQWLAPATLEDLDTLCQNIYRARAQAALITSETMVDQAVLAKVGQEMQAQQMQGAMEGGGQPGMGGPPAQGVAV